MDRKSRGCCAVDVFIGDNTYFFAGLPGNFRHRRDIFPPLVLADVAVIGLPDKRLGEIAAAIIELKEGVTMTKEEVDTYCLAMPRYKRPHEVIFADIPRNPTGKIEKPKLREKYGANRLIAEQNMG